MDDIQFVKAQENDLDALLAIYNFYVASTTATFDQGAISKDEFRQRIYLEHERYQSFTIHNLGKIAGFCFLTQFRKKKSYDRTAEIGIYLKPEFTGKGIGRTVIEYLEKIAVDKQFRVIIASISSENLASIKLFRKNGYEQCAHYKEVGEKFGRILDVIDYEKIIAL